MSYFQLETVLVQVLCSRDCWPTLKPALNCKRRQSVSLISPPETRTASAIPNEQATRHFTIRNKADSRHLVARTRSPT